MVKDSTVLLVRHRKVDAYDFVVAPGGGVQGTEDIFSAAKREAAEETGLEVRPLKLAYIEEFHQPTCRHCKFWVYCELLGGTLSVEPASAEREFIVEARFFSLP